MIPRIPLRVSRANSDASAGISQPYMNFPCLNIVILALLVSHRQFIALRCNPEYNALMNKPLTTALPQLGLYLHIPWCVQKCPYCDFNSHAVKKNTPESLYIDALLADLRRDLQLFQEQRPVQTIFIGGGTPSLFSAQSLERLLDGIRKLVALADDAEITLEANPGTFESSKFADFFQLGINRLSIGIQSFQDRHLRSLGRIHNTADALKAVDMAHQSGFENINLDLMFGLPEQNLAEAIYDIDTAIQLSPAHISFYQLTLEPNTWFYHFPPTLPEHEDIYQIQTHCQQRLAESGYSQYEISAYAKPDQRCLHNLNYWQFGDYLGIGAGAHGKISLSLPDRILRTVKRKKPAQYLLKPEMMACTEIEKAQIPLEFVMNQLRLKNGFSAIHYQTVTGLPIESLEPGLSASIVDGLLTGINDNYHCTEKGWNFLDTILEKFIA